MHRQVSVLLVTLVLIVVAVRSDQSLKCYMCTSLMTEGCDDPKTHNLEPVECTLGKMGEWQRTVQQHNVLNAVSSIFEVDNLQSHQTAAPKDMACAKMVLKISNQDVTVRSCQTAKTETIDPCKAIESKLAGDIFHLEHCDLCMHDSCNHAIASTPRTFFIFVSALGVLALGILYQSA